MIDFPPYIQIASWRMLKYIPPHFKTVVIPFIPEPYVQENIVNWIRENFTGRFFAGETTDLVEGSITKVYKIAFEEDTEITMFILGCPHYSNAY